MEHRHINTAEWTRTAIDSALERGNLSDWQELFQAARKDVELAKNILRMARCHNADGTFVLVEAFIEKIHPELFNK